MTASGVSSSEQLADRPSEAVDFLVFRNPHSDRALAAAQQVAEQLRPVARSVVIEDTEPLSNDYADFFSENTKSVNQVLVPVGGDGTLSNFMVAAWRENVKTPILPRAGGNINDLPHVLYDYHGFHDAGYAAKSGSLVPLWPLEITVHDAETRSLTVEAAINYFGVGYAGLKAHDFNDPSYREHHGKQRWLTRRISEGWTIWRDLVNADTLTIHDNESGPHEGRPMLTNLFVNTERAAQFMQFSKHSILSPRAGRIEVTANHIGGLIGGWLRAGVGIYQELEVGAEGYHFQVESKQNKFWAMYDGEDRQYNSHTAFDVRLSDRPLTVITTKRHPSYS
jgi:hypothetical protein